MSDEDTKYRITVRELAAILAFSYAQGHRYGDEDAKTGAISIPGPSIEAVVFAFNGVAERFSQVHKAWLLCASLLLRREGVPQLVDMRKGSQS